MKIAIIGSGISGLGSAYLLSPHHDVTIYEKNDYVGGHSRTVNVITPDGDIPVDTGFIVFNYRNYPHLTGLFKDLGVPITKSDMSFGASIRDGWLEYGTQSLGNIFAQKANFLRPSFWRMVYDVFYFNKNAKKYIDSDLSLSQVLRDMGLGDWFKQYYILAMGGAIWSMPLKKMLDFPAATFIQFFTNHGLLSVNDQPVWYTVMGGSRQYVKRMIAPFSDKIRYNSAVTRVERHPNKVVIHDVTGAITEYDKVIMACHTDQSMKILDNPTKEEKNIISNIRYQKNKMILHSDISFMPQNKKAWASWVYLSKTQRDKSEQLALSYWMNNLQPLQTKTDIIVTLNPDIRPQADLIHDEYDFEHPIFDAAAIKAQAKLHTIQGENHTYYAGAWGRYGFHEDGLLSAVKVAELLGHKISWTPQSEK